MPLDFDNSEETNVAEPEIYVPRGLNESRRYRDRVLVAGRGPKPSDLMFISSSALAEETAEMSEGKWTQVKTKPMYLKGPVGTALKDICLAAGINVNTSVYYTALAKWLLPKANVLNPKLTMCAPGFECLEREIEEVQPKIIVTFGKAAFEYVTGRRMRFDDAVGMWFWSDKHQCRVMPMRHQYYMLHKPEMMETFVLDFQQVHRMMLEINGVAVSKVPLDYRVVRNSQELRQLTQELMPYDLYSVDCEWHGHDHVDGLLRSMQICWAPGKAAYIRFMDDQLNYAFDVSYADAGKILAECWERPEVKLVGHHIAADLPWIHTRLGLSWINRTRLDTEFAYQTCSEHAELGLERHSLRFTDLGRYEFDLDEWKRENKKLCEGGYGYIPDEILIPYALKDVDVPMRALPFIEEELKQQNLLDYYRNILNRFCTDCFTQFSLAGLRLNTEEADSMRKVYAFAHQWQLGRFQEDMRTESRKLLAYNAARLRVQGDMPDEIKDKLAWIMHKRAFDSLCASSLMPEHDTDEHRQRILAEHGATPDDLKKLARSLDFVSVCDLGFNLSSAAHKKQWLFDVRGYMPIKSTGNKNKGVSSMAWEKVLRMKPEKQAEMTPAVDKQSLQILSVQYSDPLVKRMLALSAIGTIRKNLLKEPVRDDETGEILEEEGLLAWVAQDGCVHGQMSLTETGRPRAWKPNILNWPSFVQDQIKDMIAEALKEAHAVGRLPKDLERFVDGRSSLMPIRSLVQARSGWCHVESDYVTAEIFGLAYISGDDNLIRILETPDDQFAVLNDKDGSPIRLKYAADCGIPAENQDPECIMALWDKGKKVRAVVPDELVYEPDGSLKHPRVDLHWQLAEAFKKKPREKLDKKADRGGGKVGNFSTAYGATAATVERKIEADTGVKPEPGTGQGILDALDVRQPRAQQMLRDLECIPGTTGYIRAASGRIRHFVKIKGEYRASRRDQEQVLNSQGREARNFLMQESVASTAARAAVWMLDFGAKFGLKGTTYVCLYDSLVTDCPHYERHLWAKAHKVFMSLANGWEYHNRVFRYQIDTEFNFGWSLTPKMAGKPHMDAVFRGRDYAPTPDYLRHAEDWLNALIKFYTDNPRASLHPELLKF